MNIWFYIAVGLFFVSFGLLIHIVALHDWMTRRPPTPTAALLEYLEKELAQHMEQGDLSKAQVARFERLTKP